MKTGEVIVAYLLFKTKKVTQTCIHFSTENSLENIALSALLQILQSVDMSDSGQANTAISVVDTLVSGPVKSSIPTGNIFQVYSLWPKTNCDQ